MSISVERGQDMGLAFRLKRNVLNAAGQTSPDLRRDIASYVTAVSVSGTVPPHALPPAVAALVLKITLHAYKVTDDDIAVLKRADFSEDAIFEVIVTAAVAAGLVRLDVGLAVAREER